MHVKDKDLRQKALKMLMQKSLVKKKKEDEDSPKEEGESKEKSTGGKSVTVTVSY
jgi:hypothetical protein